jgi:hypothetical protein
LIQWIHFVSKTASFILVTKNLLSLSLNFIVAVVYAPI